MSIPFIAGAVEFRNRRRRLRTQQRELLSQPDELFFEESPLVEHHLIL